MNRHIIKIILSVYIFITIGISTIFRILIVSQALQLSDINLIVNALIAIFAVILLISKDKDNEKIMAILIICGYGLRVIFQIVNIIITWRFHINVGGMLVPIALAIAFLFILHREESGNPIMASKQHKDAQLGPVEIRLNKLQKLYDDGLISRDEYDDKRRQIIEDI